MSKLSKISLVLIPPVIGLVGFAIALSAQGTGSLLNLRGKTDANNALLTSVVGYTSPQSALQNFANIRVKTDAAGALVVTTGSAGPVFTAGAGTNTYRPSGVIGTVVSTQVPSTANTNFVCVSLGSITANTLNAAGDTLEVIADFERSAAAATITLTVNIGGTCVADATGFTGGVNIVSSTNLGTVSIAYDTHVWVVRGATAATSRIRDWMVRTGNTTAGSATSATSGSINWAVTNTIGLGFKTSASGATDVLLNTARVLFSPAP